MTSFSLPVFSRLSPKINRAERELAQIERYCDSNSPEVAAGDWGAMSAVSLGIHNVYNGIEDILLSLARDIDDSVPTGALRPSGRPRPDGGGSCRNASGAARSRPLGGSHGTQGISPLVRHRYGFDLKTDKVIENLALLQKVFPVFIDAVTELERAMREGDDHNGDGGLSGGPRR
jgi:hypothetical protein